MRKIPFKIPTYCLCAVIVVLALTGCGRKGGLYLPENVKPENETAQPVQVPGEDEN